MAEKICKTCGTAFPRLMKIDGKLHDLKSRQNCLNCIPFDTKTKNPLNRCKLCGKTFPNFVKINGALRNLHNRSYCLSCSPFNSHNTKKLEPKEDRCIVCTTPLTGLQTHYCSTKCKVKTYSQKPDYIKKRRKYQKIYDRKIRNQRWKRAVKYKGGICQRCKCTHPIVCYDFHHIKDKDTNINKMMRGNWEKIKMELDKCILVCGNCHQEIHEERDRTIISDKYMNNYMNKYHRINKKKSVDFLGGKCTRCGYIKSLRALCFHHLKDKLFTLSSNLNKSFETLKPELDKCILLCINCHRIRHSESR